MYFVGIDPGGTKCEVVICDEEANIVGYAYNKADLSKINLDPNANYRGYGRTYKTIKETFEEASKDLNMSETFIVNCGDKDNGCKVFSDLSIKSRYSRCHEYDGIGGASNIDDAYIVLSGTGAFVTYRYGHECLYFDGIGPNLGDYGGGYYIGIRGIRAVAISEWDEAYKTSMASYINNKIIGQENNACGRDLAYPFMKIKGRTEIASFSYIVNNEAEKGDKIAIGILKEAGEALGNTVRCLVQNVRPNPNNLPLVCDGSILQKCTIYREAFMNYCKKNLPNNEIIFSPMPQAFGLVMVGLRAYLPEKRNELYKKLMENFKNM